MVQGGCMFSIILDVLIGCAGISLLIFLHEGAHYIVACLCKIHVEVFSVGIGPAFYKKKLKNGTELRFCVILFGGFCTLRGGRDIVRALESGEDRFVEVEEGSLFSVSPWKSMLVYLAGPVMNIIFATVCFALYLCIPHPVVYDPAVVLRTAGYPLVFGETVESDFQDYDEIKSLDGVQVKDWAHFQQLAAENPDKIAYSAEILRDGKLLSVNVKKHETPEGSFIFGVTSYVEPVVGEVVSLSGEAVAGLSKGDRILTANGMEIKSMMDLMTLQARGDRDMNFTVLHDNGKTEEISFLPKIGADGHAVFSFSLISKVRYEEGKGFLQALSDAASNIVKLSKETVSTIFALFEGNRKVSDTMSGTLRTSRLIGSIARSSLEVSVTTGIRSTLYLLSTVSISLGIANLLPLPGLDGGQVIICIVEIITGKRIRPSSYRWFQLAGIAVIVGLLILISLSSMMNF